MNNCTDNQDKIKKIFSLASTPEARYELIISMGRTLPPMNAAHKTPENIVDGCQSKLYLHALLVDGQLQFEVDSDALISKGLAAILIQLYNNKSPEYILKNPPTILSDLNIFASLSPTRAHGLKSLHLKMQKIALQHIIQTEEFTS